MMSQGELSWASWDVLGSSGNWPGITRSALIWVCTNA